jgi:hypothetical protein
MHRACCPQREVPHLCRLWLEPLQLNGNRHSLGPTRITQRDDTLSWHPGTEHPESTDCDRYAFLVVEPLYRL